MDHDQQDVIGDLQNAVNGNSTLEPVGLLSRQGAKSFRQYCETKSINDIDEAIEFTEAAVRAVPQDYPQVLDTCLGNLATFFRARYEKTESIADLNESIRITKQHINLNLRDPKELVSLLSACLSDRSFRTGSVEDQQETVEILRAVLDDTSPKDSSWPLRLGNLGYLFIENYRHRGSTEDLEEALRLFKDGIDNTLIDHQQKPRILYAFGSSLYVRYVQEGSENDLYAAIENIEAALDSPLIEERAWDVLGNAIYHRYQRKGSGNDLEKFIRIQKNLLRKNPETHSERPQRLNSLGVGYRCQHLESGAEKPLQEAVKINQRALKAIHEGHPIYATLRHNLGLCFGNQYNMTRSEDALNSAIDNELAAVVAFKENDRNHAGEIRSKDSLQAHFSEKYRRHGVQNELKSAISFAQDVVDGTPQNDPYYVTYLGNLAGLFFDAHLTVPSNMTILDEAVRLTELSADIIPAHHLEQAEMLSNLSFVYNRRFQITGSANDLKEAIKRGDAAVEATIKDHRRLGARLANLGFLWRDLQ